MLFLQMFENKFGYRITMNVLEMDIEPQASGTLDVYDGRDKTWPKLASYMIMNGTHPMGITSTYNSMFVEFSWSRPPRGGCPTLTDCVKFTILIDSTTGKLVTLMFVIIIIIIIILITMTIYNWRHN